MKIYNYVYKITQLSTNKYYIGLRSSNIAPELDSYMGSGILITRLIKKYSFSDFKKEILFVFDTREEASLKEQELVTKDVLQDPLCLNLKTGGDCGAFSIYMPILTERVGNKNPNFGNTKKPSQEIIEKRRQGLLNSKRLKLSRQNPEFKEKISNIQSKTVLIFDEYYVIKYSFKNCRVAAEFLGVTRANISNAIRDKRKIGKRIKILSNEYYVCFEHNFENYKNEIENRKTL